LISTAFLLWGKTLDRKTNPSLRIIGKASKHGDILVPKRRCGDFRRLEMQVLMSKSTPPSFADQRLFSVRRNLSLLSIEGKNKEPFATVE
jgi:hypothetical protein